MKIQPRQSPFSFLHLTLSTPHIISSISPTHRPSNHHRLTPRSTTASNPSVPATSPLATVQLIIVTSTTTTTTRKETHQRPCLISSSSSFSARRLVAANTSAAAPAPPQPRTQVPQRRGELVNLRIARQARDVGLVAGVQALDVALRFGDEGVGEPEVVVPVVCRKEALLQGEGEF